MSYKRKNFGILGGEAKGGASIRLYSYLLDKEETFDDLLATGYFNEERERLLPNDLIKVLMPDKDFKLGYLMVKKITLDNVEVIKVEIDAKSDLLPLPDSDNGSAGTSDLISRYDHQHPKVIATEEDRGQIIIASEEETLQGTNNTKAITPLKNKLYFDNQQATSQEINNGEDVKKYINPLQVKTIKDELQENIDNNTISINNNTISINNNKIVLDNIKKTGLTKWENNIEYSIGDFVFILDEELKPYLYYSIANNNLNNSPLLDKQNQYWEKLQLGGSGGGNLLDFKFVDHQLDDQSWLRSDTFSWHDGVFYRKAYQHLLNDIKDKTTTTETVDTITINYILADDGHKIILADDTETLDNLETLYTNTGIAWYYILDTENTRFKLPRTRWNFVGLRPNGSVGEYVEESLPNITGTFGGNSYNPNNGTGAFSSIGGAGNNSGGDYNMHQNKDYYFDASRSSSAYQNNASVQQKATQMILYFYVGEEKVSVIEDYKINNTVPLACPIYTPNLFEDVNYLLSDNQWHSGEIYEAVWELLINQYNNENSVEITKTLSDGTSLTLKKTPLDYLICKVDENNTEEKINKFYNEIRFTCWAINTTTNEFKLPQNTKRELVESWKDGSSNWYNLYNDGWLEQGGYNFLSKNVKGEFFTQALLVPMADINYQVVLNFESKDRVYHPGANMFLFSDSYTTTTFNYAVKGGDNAKYKVSSSWKVEGYANTSALENQFNFSNYLYFKVGNTTVGAELVYTNKVLTEIAKKANTSGDNLTFNNLSNTAKENIINTALGGLQTTDPSKVGYIIEMKDNLVAPVNSTYTLPSGGTWFVNIICAGNGTNYGIGSGGRIVAGGTAMNVDSRTQTLEGFAIKIQ